MVTSLGILLPFDMWQWVEQSPHRGVVFRRLLSWQVKEGGGIFNQFEKHALISKVKHHFHHHVQSNITKIVRNYILNKKTHTHTHTWNRQLLLHNASTSPLNPHKLSTSVLKCLLHCCQHPPPPHSETLCAWKVLTYTHIYTYNCTHTYIHTIIHTHCYWCGNGSNKSPSLNMTFGPHFGCGKQNARWACPTPPWRP